MYANRLEPFISSNGKFYFDSQFDLNTKKGNYYTNELLKIFTEKPAKIQSFKNPIKKSIEKNNSNNIAINNYKKNNYYLNNKRILDATDIKIDYYYRLLCPDIDGFYIYIDSTIYRYNLHTKKIDYQYLMNLHVQCIESNQNKIYFGGNNGGKIVQIGIYSLEYHFNINI